MKRFITVLVTVLLLGTFAFADGLSDSLQTIVDEINAKLTTGTYVLVSEFTSDESLKRTDFQYTFNNIQDQFQTKLCNASNVRLINRDSQSFQLLNEEEQFQLSGVVSDESTLSICRKVGAQILIEGKLKRTSNGYSLYIQATDIETYVIIYRNEITWVSSNGSVETEADIAAAAEAEALAEKEAAEKAAIEKAEAEAAAKAAENAKKYNWDVLARETVALAEDETLDSISLGISYFITKKISVGLSAGTGFILSSEDLEDDTNNEEEEDFDDSDMIFNIGGNVRFYPSTGFLAPYVGAQYDLYYGFGATAGLRINLGILVAEADFSYFIPGYFVTTLAAGIRF